MSALLGQESDAVSFNGITIAPGVVETIVALAASQVEGVASVRGRSPLRKKEAAPDVDVALVDGNLTCAVHIIAQYGHVLPQVGKNVQEGIADALDAQMGIRPTDIDVFIDGIQFED
jgi:uncharacterized alkaline shock family protein YloU